LSNPVLPQDGGRSRHFLLRYFNRDRDIPPIITGNFSASSGDHWTVPVGGGIGKLWRIGKVGLPLNTQLVPFYNVVTPDFGPDWQLRFQFQFLFPR
jgi:hypothetical protein